METWAQKYTGAWNRHSATDVAAFMTADVVAVDTTLGETFRGPPAVGQWVESMVASFSSDFSVVLRHSIVTSTGFATEWLMRGTHDGSSHDVAATGKRFEIRGATVGEVRDGKICGLRQYWDRAGFLAQVGAPDGALSASSAA
jgi:steroid delta-isomerase-like uncharacterized protein